jgi:hypothetical protein
MPRVKAEQPDAITRALFIASGVRDPGEIEYRAETEGRENCLDIGDTTGSRFP